MLSLRIWTSLPASTIVVNALWAEDGFTVSLSSMSESFVRPMIRLLFCRKGVPPTHVVQVLLNDDVASARKLSVFSSDERGIQSGFTTGILCTVNESKQVAIFEIAKAVCLVDGSDRASNSFHDL